MNSLERILAAVRFQPTDRTPFLPQLFGHAAVTAGIPLGDYLRDGARLAAAQLLERRTYGSDGVFAFLDLGVETEALGSRLEYFGNRYPEVAEYALAPADDPSILTIPDPRRAGRMPEVLRALGELRRGVGDTALVIGAVAGPMTLAAQLYGIEAALYLAMDDPGRHAAALDLAVEVAIRYGRAQLAAGAHLVMVFDPAASPAVVPADFFRSRLQPRLARLLAALHEAGATATWLNIAGPTADILPHYADMGADIATFDYYVAPAEARRLLPHTCLVGNLKSLDCLDPAPAALAAQARELTAAFAAGGGFILSSGCEIPPEADAATLAALAEAAREG